MVCYLFKNLKASYYSNSYDVEGHVKTNKLIYQASYHTVTLKKAIDIAWDVKSHWNPAMLNFIP